MFSLAISIALLFNRIPTVFCFFLFKNPNFLSQNIYYIHSSFYAARSALYSQPELLYCYLFGLFYQISDTSVEQRRGQSAVSHQVKIYTEAKAPSVQKMRPKHTQKIMKQLENVVDLAGFQKSTPALYRTIDQLIYHVSQVPGLKHGRAIYFFILLQQYVPYNGFNSFTQPRTLTQQTFIFRPFELT